MPIPACPRIKLEKLGKLIPEHWRETLEQNQLISSCCRHPENHEIEAFRTDEDEKAPNVYILYCKCGRKHIRWTVCDGVRPFWEVR